MEHFVTVEGKEYPLLFSAHALETIEGLTGEPTMFWITPEGVTHDELQNMTPEREAQIERELSKKFFLRRNLKMLIGAATATLDEKPNLEGENAIPTDQEALTKMVMQVMAAFADAHGVNDAQKKSTAIVQR